MDKLIEKLYRMTWNEAHNYLMDQDLPQEMRVKLEAEAQHLRQTLGKATRRARLSQGRHAEAWHRLIAPLKYELSNARVGLQLKPFDVAPERHEAFTKYVAFLFKKLAQLQALQEQEMAKITAENYLDEQEQIARGDRPTGIDWAKDPAELAEEAGLPNKGAHWTDWVSDRARQQIELLFDAIPTEAKRPKPFAYRIPPAMFRTDMAALQRRTINELAIARQELEMLEGVVTRDPDRPAKIDALRDKVTGMELALSATLRMRNEPVPVTWHGIKVPENYVDLPDWVEWTPQLEQTMRTALGMDKPRQPTKKRTNRPKRYKKV